MTVVCEVHIYVTIYAFASDVLQERLQPFAQTAYFVSTHTHTDRQSTHSIPLAVNVCTG